MARTPRIIGLRDFSLTLAALSRLGPRPARLSIQLTGETTSKLRHLRPKQRDAALRETLAKQLDRLRHEFSAIDFVSRGKNKASWTIDAVVPAKSGRGLGKQAARQPRDARHDRRTPKESSP